MKNVRRAVLSCHELTFGLLVFALSLSAIAGNLNPQYNSRVWQVEDGLPQNIVQAIVQTRDGYLWVGTQKGLARFDGDRFTVFDKTTTPALSGQFITSLCESRDGSLWISSTDGGVMRYKAGKFIHYGEHEGLSTNYVKVVHETDDGILWVGTVSGLERFRNGKFEVFSPYGPWNFMAVRSMGEDSNGMLWVGTDRGLLRAKGDQLFICRDREGGTSGGIRSLYADKDQVWLGGISQGLYSYVTNADFSWTNSFVGLADNMVTSIFRDSNQHLWVGTYAGLFRSTTNGFVNEISPERMSYNTVNAFCEDREGNLWFGTKDGLHQFTPRLFKTFTEADGLTRNNVITIKEDTAGKLWVGTWGGGVNIFQDGTFSATVPSEPENQRVINLVLSFLQSRDGAMWIGTDYGGGLFRCHSNVFTRYYAPHGLTDRPVRVLHEDRNGNIWVGTTLGLNLFKDGTFTRYGKDKGLPSDTIRVIHEDRHGVVWFGTQEGLSRFENGAFKNFTTRDGLSHNVISALYEDGNGGLWIGTVGGGINRLRDGKFTSYTTRQGLFNDDVFEIVEDDFGCFWMTCRYGISRVRKEDFDNLDQGRLKVLRSTSYGRRDGILSTECNSVGKPAAIKTRDGRLWFATAKGLSMVQPTPDFKLNDVVPSVVIEKVLADEATHTSETPRHFADITVPPGRGELEFHYTVLSLMEPGKNRFRYKLDGVDADWVEAGTRHVAYYNNIRPGNYRFRVVACNNDGLWNEQGASVALSLQPHFYETWWFITSTITLGITAVALIARYLTQRRLRLRLQILQHQHALDKERARIAKDMHDHLGANLTRLGLLSELARRDAAKPEQVANHTEKISQMTREVATTLDEIVWSVNPENDTLKRLVAYIVHYAEEFFESASIRCRIDIPTDLPDHSLEADVRHNLFSVVKESLNNIAKHSGASETWVHLTVRDSVLEVCIEDNGKGFSMENVDPTRNGLTNLRKRLEDIRGRCEIVSEPGKGTRIQFFVSMDGKSLAKDGRQIKETAGTLAEA